MHKYIAKVIEKIDDSPGPFKRTKVGVFKIENELEEQVCDYVRNYSTLFNTFFHFKKNEKDYALYSPNYTATRVMELPSGKDIGGEEPKSWGFCPVDFYVPSYIEQELETTRRDGTREVIYHRVNQPNQNDLLSQTDSVHHSRPLTPLLYYPFGFVAGCIWADDSSMKIQYLDLSEVEKGIIKRDERFGYIAKAEGLTLKQAIDLSDYLYDANEEDAYRVTISIQRSFDLRTGKPVE